MIIIERVLHPDFMIHFTNLHGCSLYYLAWCDCASEKLRELHKTKILFSCKVLDILYGRASFQMD